MRSRIAAAVAGLFGLLVSLLVFAQPATAATGFYISNGKLLDANGNNFVMRGVSHAHTWYPSQTSSFANIKALGANTVRVVLSSGDRWTKNDTADVANVVSLCKANKLICVLEVHDTTGYGEDSAATTLDKAADYWISIKSALEGQEKYIILNIGNEPYGNQNYTAWTADTENAIKKLRNAGFAHTIMVDAPNWGQDWAFTMRDNASAVFAADPNANTIFSIHMYGVYDTAAEVSDYLNHFVSAKLPIVVGEFGNMHTDGDPDEDAIMSNAQSLGIGYLGWSWSGNSSDVAYLDMTNSFNPNSLTPWGERIFNGANGIKATAKEASVYAGGDSDDTTPPSVPGTPTASSVTSSSVKLSWTAATDNEGVAAYDVVQVNGSTETTVTSVTTNSATVTGLTAETAYTFAVYARDAAGNKSDRSGPVNVTTTAPSQGECTVAYDITSQWQGGFQAAVTIGNTSEAAINNWTLEWSFANGQTITNMWGGTAKQSGADVTVTNASYTGNIPPGGSVEVGFTGTQSGTNAEPAQFMLNGAYCTVV